jgi:hypothetical protein
MAGQPEAWPCRPSRVLAAVALSGRARDLGAVQATTPTRSIPAAAHSFSEATRNPGQGLLVAGAELLLAIVGLCEIEMVEPQATSSICSRSIWSNQRIVLDSLRDHDHAGEFRGSRGAVDKPGLTNQSLMVVPGRPL